VQIELAARCHLLLRIPQRPLIPSFPAHKRPCSCAKLARFPAGPDSGRTGQPLGGEEFLSDQPASHGRVLSAEPPVVVVAGEIDLAVAPSLQACLEKLLDYGHLHIYVDLLEATFLDSIALGVLVGALEQCRKAGGDLHLVVNEPRILRVLEITGLSGTFTLHSSLDLLAELGPWPERTGRVGEAPER